MPILRSLLLAAGAALIAAAPAAAVIHLPTVERTLSASKASSSCVAGSTDSATYTAKMAGFLTASLRGSGEWDLTLTDAASGRTLGSSRAFGATEVTQSWVDAGQKLRATACRTSGSASSVGLSFDFVDAAKPAKTTASIIRIPRVSQKMHDKLSAAGFDLEEMTITPTEMDVFIPSAAKLNAFKRFGIPFKVRYADLDAKNARDRAAEARRTRAGYKGLVPSGRTEYRFLADFQSEMNKIATDNPGFVKKLTIGQTVQGRMIQGLEFSTDVNATDDGKPTYFLMGVHHAREWPSAEIAMEYMHLLAKGYNQDTTEGARIRTILNNTRIIVVPVLNMDGYAASRGENPTGVPVPDVEDTLETGGTAEGLTGTFAYRRKNCGGPAANPVSSAPQQQPLPCYYQTGVDPNRNYGFDWGGPGAGSSPTDQTYRGTGQWSEPETQAVWRTSQNRPVTVLVTMHTIAALVLRSPGLKTNGLAPDETLLKELGDKIGKLTSYTSQYGWQLYDTTGTTEDWNYGAVGALGYTIEIGPKNGVFHGDYKIAVEDQWVGKSGTKILGGMKEALLTAAEYSYNPKTHSIISGTGPGGAELELKKTFLTETSPVCVFSQGVIASAPAPADCAAAGTLPNPGTQDGLTYKTRIKTDGTFNWHVTQSTRPFEGYTYDAATKSAKSNGKKESWTLTCKVDGTAVGTPKTIVIERGDQQPLGNVCAA